MATILQDGTMFTGKNCGQLTKQAAVKKLLKFQYNMALAFSTTTIEVSANSYESARSGYLKLLNPARLFNLFQIFDYRLP